MLHVAMRSNCNQHCLPLTGPMLTDSGGYQIFSMGFGSVSNEIKGKRYYKPSWIRNEMYSS